MYKRRTAATLRLQSKNNEKLTQVIEELEKKFASADTALRSSQVSLRNRDDAISKLEEQLECCETARKEMELEYNECVRSPNMNELNIIHDELNCRIQSMREEYITLEASLHVAHRNEIQRINAEHEREVYEMQRELERVSAIVASSHSPNVNLNTERTKMSGDGMQITYNKLDKYNLRYNDSISRKGDDNINEEERWEKENVKLINEYEVKSEEERKQMFESLLEEYRRYKTECLKQYCNNDHVSTIITHDGRFVADDIKQQQKESELTEFSKERLSDIAESMSLSNANTNRLHEETGNLNNISTIADEECMPNEKTTDRSENKLKLKIDNTREKNASSDATNNALGKVNETTSEVIKLQLNIRQLKEELWNANKENIKLKQNINAVKLPWGALDAQQVQYLKSVIIKILCNLKRMDVIKHLLPVLQTVMEIRKDEMAHIYQCNPS